MTEREIFGKYDNLNEDELNKKKKTIKTLMLEMMS